LKNYNPLLFYDIFLVVNPQKKTTFPQTKKKFIRITINQERSGADKFFLKKNYRIY
jgi:hypothetical protein